MRWPSPPSSSSSFDQNQRMGKKWQRMLMVLVGATLSLSLAGTVSAADPGTDSALRDFWSVLNRTWGDVNKNVIVSNSGYDMKLSLDTDAGAALDSYSDFLYGYWSISMKLVPGNSAGTVCTFYLISDEPDPENPTRDELDIEFLGNSSGEPYTLHTNVYTNGTGTREQRFNLWFDPTKDYHNYTILWNSNHVVFSVDEIPIRVFRNYEYLGIPYPKYKPMKLKTSLWNADDWATQNGKVKTNWSAAPFVASYKNLYLEGCLTGSYSPDCAQNSSYLWNQPQFQYLNYAQQGQLNWARNVALLYDYCDDYGRFQGQLLPECFQPQY